MIALDALFLAKGKTRMLCFKLHIWRIEGEKYVENLLILDNIFYILVVR